MNILKRFLTGVLLLCSLLVQANTSILNTGPNSLPAPAWIQAVEITESKIKIEWAPVSGAVEYKVSRFDVTNNVQLPDEYMVEPEFTSQPHDPGTTIQFEVAAIDENNELGATTEAEYTTTIIIVDDIASFSVPNTPGGNQQIAPGELLELSVPNADKNSQTVNVTRVKISEGSNFAEFLVWSHCIDQDNPGIRVQYYQENNWPASVTAQEVVIGEIGSGQTACSMIRFRINQINSFFTVLQPAFSSETGRGKIFIQNNMKTTNITYDRSTNSEVNPCYVPGFQVQDVPETLDPNGASDGSEDASATTASLLETSANQALRVSPNPFHDAFKVEYEVAQSGAVQLQLTDLTGKTVQNISFDSLLTGTYTAYLTTNTLPAGMYLLTVQTENGRTTVPVVKH